MQSHSRRTFLQKSIATTATISLFESGQVLVSRSQAAESKCQPIRLGGPVFTNTQDPEEMALAHRQLGYRAAYCPGVSLNDSARIRALADAFAKHDVVIAEVGRWFNLLDLDLSKRRESLEKVIEGLALADAIGARCCVDIAGSYSSTSWFGPHPDNLTPKHFDASVENARKIIDAVKPKRSKFCFEMMGWAYPDSAESCFKLIKAVDRKAFGVHLDPCNIINSPEKFYRNSALLNECFDKLGRWVASCHAKDLAWEVEMNVHFREVVPGKGSLDYATYLKRVAMLPQNPPLMLEHLSGAEEYTAGRQYIFDVGKTNGLSFA
jgi:sugar phosphate isomerase/epimerase